MVIDEACHRLLSRREPNNEPELLQLLADVAALGQETTWAVDLADGVAALLITILTAHGQALIYLPGRAVNRATDAYRGGKTSARDALVIADQARMRRDLRPMRHSDQISTDLKILTVRRADLVADRTRGINRLRARLAETLPALERALALEYARPLILLTGYQSPAALRRLGRTRLETWLRRPGVRGAVRLTAMIMEAAEAQHTTIPGEQATVEVIADLARTERLRQPPLVENAITGTTKTMLDQYSAACRAADNLKTDPSAILSSKAWNLRIGSLEPYPPA